MPLIGINSTQKVQRQLSKLEQIAMGLDIAQKVLGTALAVPEYLQKKKANEAQIKTSEAQQQVLEKTIPIREAEQKREQALTLGTIHQKFRPVTETDTSAPIVDFGPEYGGKMTLRTEQADLSDYEKKLMEAYSKDYTIVSPDNAGKDDVKTSFGGHDVYWRVKSTDDPGKIDDQTAKRRQEFLKESANYQIQVDGYSKIKAQEKAAISGSAPAQVSLIYSFIKLVDPGSVVKEGEIALASQAKGVPETVLNTYNQLVKGAKLSPAQVSEFISTAKRTFGAANVGHKKRESFYRMLATHEGLKPEFVVPDLNFNEGATGPNDKDAEEF